MQQRRLQLLSNSCKNLSSLLELTFETSLNTFLAVNKLQSNVSDLETYKVISNNIEGISKKMKVHISETLRINEDLRSVLQVAGPDQMSSSNSIEKSNFVMPKALLGELVIKIESIEKLNHKIWLSNNQLKVQFSQNEGDASLHSVSENIENLNSSFEDTLKKMRSEAASLDLAVMNQIEKRKYRSVI